MRPFAKRKIIKKNHINYLFKRKINFMTLLIFVSFLFILFEEKPEILGKL